MGGGLEVIACLICGKVPEPAFKDTVEPLNALPWKATTFSTPGHYGSTVFDPLPHRGERLYVLVCDPCLIAASRAERVALLKPAPPVEQPEDSAELWVWDREGTPE